jgi:hypothetical protein
MESVIARLYLVTMRRPWWTRLVAGVLGIWLVLVLGEPGVVHTCPTHGAAVPSDAAAHSHAMGHAVGAALDADGDRHAPPHEHQGCTCIGCCVSVSAVALIDRAPTTAIAVALVPVVAGRTPVTLLPRPGPRHSRPYPTGPPRA